MNVYVVLATLAWGCWGFCQKNAAMRMGTVDVQLVSFLSGLLIMPVYFQAYSSSWSFKEMDARAVAWAAAAHAFSLYASYAYLKAIKSVDLSTVSMVTSVYPVVTFILAAFFLGEKVTVWKMIGIPVVLAGIWISGRS